MEFGILISVIPLPEKFQKECSLSYGLWLPEKLAPLQSDVYLTIPKGGFSVIPEITRCHTFTKKKSTMQVLAANISIRISIVKIVCKCFFSRDRKAGLRHQLPYFLFYMPRCLFNFGTFRCSIYKTVAFISKIKTEENEIMCQFKTIRYFLNHELWN